MLDKPGSSHWLCFVGVMLREQCKVNEATWWSVSNDELLSAAPVFSCRPFWRVVTHLFKVLSYAACVVAFRLLFCGVIRLACNALLAPLRRNGADILLLIRSFNPADRHYSSQAPRLRMYCWSRGFAAVLVACGVDW